MHGLSFLSKRRESRSGLESRVGLCARLYGIGCFACRQFRGLILVKHVVGDRVGIMFQRMPPIANKRWSRLQSRALLRPVERQSRQSRIKGPVLVAHDHDAVSPAMETKIVGGGESPRETRIRIVYEDTVAVGDDAIGSQEKSHGNGAAFGVTASPTKHAVIFP